MNLFEKLSFRPLHSSAFPHKTARSLEPPGSGEFFNRRATGSPDNRGSGRYSPPFQANHAVQAFPVLPGISGPEPASLPWVGFSCGSMPAWRNSRAIGSAARRWPFQPATPRSPISPVSRCRWRRSRCFTAFQFQSIDPVEGPGPSFRSEHEHKGQENPSGSRIVHFAVFFLADAATL